MTVPINNPQPDSYGDSVPYQGSMPLPEWRTLSG